MGLIHHNLRLRPAIFFAMFSTTSTSVRRFTSREYFNFHGNQKPLRDLPLPPPTPEQRPTAEIYGNTMESLQILCQSLYFHRISQYFHEISQISSPTAPP